MNYVSFGVDRKYLEIECRNLLKRSLVTIDFLLFSDQLTNNAMNQIDSSAQYTVG